MNFWDAIYKIAKSENLNTTGISQKAGMSRAYIASQKNSNTDARLSTMCKLLNACGYGLYVIQRDKKPDDAIELSD